MRFFGATPGYKGQKSFQACGSARWKAIVYVQNLLNFYIISIFCKRLLGIIWGRSIFSTLERFEGVCLFKKGGAARVGGALPGQLADPFQIAYIVY